MKRDLSFYEFSGIFLPGAVLLGGTLLTIDEARLWILSEDFGASQLGLFLISAYVVGQLLQGLGNLVEKIYWVGRGIPSHWVTRESIPFLHEQHAKRIGELFKKLTDLEIADRKSLRKKDSRNLTGSLFSVVKKEADTSRIDVFNGNYGLFRGLSTSFLILILFNVGVGTSLPTKIILTICLLLALVRMERFAVHYARELYHLSFQILTSKSKNS